MRFVIFAVILFISWIIGICGWAQIIGGLQNLKSRGCIMLVTITIWLVIIGLTLLIVLKFFDSYIWAWIIGMAISFLKILTSGKIE